ncbi:MAG: HAD family hydrolase [Treponema sp.]|nr:HAD family hydrolase [Treponema sp.]
MENIKVVAFDIDGTLYPQWTFYARMWPHFLKYIRTFYHFGRVRVQLRKTAPLPDFFKYQITLMAERLGCSFEKAERKLNRAVYEGLPKYFKHVKPYDGVRETFAALKEAGYKVAILSDFPPSQKGDLWGLLPYCDYVKGSEEIGALKPSKYAFGSFAKELGVDPSQILYVGNHKKYDVLGAKNAGFKTALRISKNARPYEEADINFSSYKEFMEIFLNK